MQVFEAHLLCIERLTYYAVKFLRVKLITAKSVRELLNDSVGIMLEIILYYFIAENA